MRALREILARPELLVVLVWRDLKARYRGSVLGFLWTFLNPLLLMTIYSLVFSVYMRLNISAYPIFVFAGLLPWMWFSSALVLGSSSIADSGGLVKRVAFPPQLLPVVAVTATLVNFLLTLPLLFAFVVASGLPLRWTVVALPIPIAILYALALGLALTLAMLTVRYRDLQQLLTNVLTLWFFVTPVLYPKSMVPERFHAIIELNPMVAVIGGFQDIVYYGRLPAVGDLAPVAAVAAGVLVAALVLTERMRWTIVEEV